jgi:hypothetical protein
MQSTSIIPPPDFVCPSPKGSQNQDLQCNQFSLEFQYNLVSKHRFFPPAAAGRGKKKTKKKKQTRKKQTTLPDFVSPNPKGSKISD